MSFDVFISYSQRDNKPAHPSEMGWVDSFHLALDKFLTEFLGREVEIWRDVTRMPGNSRLDSAIYENLKEADILLPILSPNFLGSLWCPQELEFFHTQKDHGRIFPIVKSPISQPPSEVSDNYLKYKFYVADKNSVREIDPSFGSDYRSKLNLLTSDLAREIAEQIKGIRKEGSQESSPSKLYPARILDDPRPVIYLAEPSPDLWEKYDDIKRDLEQRKCSFLPDRIDPLRKPKQAKDFQRQVRDALSSCNLSIELLGGENNLFPAESRTSYLHLQGEVLAERDGDMRFRRLVWSPRSLVATDREHGEFVERVGNSTFKNVEFFQNSLEDFKTCIQDALRPENSPATRPLADDPPWVYVLYDECDLEAARDLEFLLKDQGCEVFSSKDYIRPLKRGDTDVNANELHRQWLSKCDSVLIYWRSSKFYWVNNNIFEVQKSKAYREHDFKTNAVVCDGDLEDEEKKDFRPRFDLLKVTSGSLTEPLKKYGYSEFPNLFLQLGTRG